MFKFLTYCRDRTPTTHAGGKALGENLHMLHLVSQLPPDRVRPADLSLRLAPPTVAWQRPQMASSPRCSTPGHRSDQAAQDIQQSLE